MSYRLGFVFASAVQGWVLKTGLKKKKQHFQYVAKIGRPTDYTPELAERICNYVADGGSLVNAPDWCPVPKTIRQWRKKHSEFSTQLDRAYVDSADAQAEMGLNQLLDDSRDWYEKTVSLGHGDSAITIKEKLPNNVPVQRDKAIAGYRMQLAAKRNPDKYGKDPEVVKAIASIARGITVAGMTNADLGIE